MLPKESFLLKPVPDIIAHKTQCLLTGYISHRNLKISSYQSIPMAMQELCCSYFSVDFIKQIKNHFITLHEINDFTKAKIINYLFAALCPQQNYKNFISVLYHLLDAFNSCILYSHQFYIYLSILLLLTKSSIFSDALLNETEISNKMIDLLILFNRNDSYMDTHKYKLEILISLFNQNINYCILFRQKTNQSIWQYLQQHNRISYVLNISFSKSLCRYLLCNAVKYSGDVDSDIDVWEFIAECSINHQIVLFLIKELEFIVNHIQEIHGRDNILIHIEHLSDRIVANEMLSGIDKILIDAFYSRITRLQLMISRQIINFDLYSKIITYSMQNKLNESGWKLLQRLVDELESIGSEYIYFEKLISFIEHSTGLFKINMVSMLYILKDRMDNDRILIEAQNQLKLSAETCWKINKLIQNRIINEHSMMKFNTFYTKVSKTKLIKPILQFLESTKSIKHQINIINSSKNNNYYKKTNSTKQQHTTNCNQIKYQ